MRTVSVSVYALIIKDEISDIRRLLHLQPLYIHMYVT